MAYPPLSMPLKAKEDVRALGVAAPSADAMDIDVSELRNYYKILAEAATTLFLEISLTMVTQAKSPPRSKILSWVAKSLPTTFGW
jgi:hypothetical protein